MISRTQFAISVSGMHVRQVGPHRLIWDHGHVLDAQWLKDVFLKVIVEGKSTDTFKRYASPVDADL